jgi:membrane protease YdiL (CAAX protease family)
MGDSSSRALGNTFGIWEAGLGLAVGFLLAIVAVSAYDAIAGPHPSQLGTDVVDFAALWAGFVGAAIVASRTRGFVPARLEPVTADSGRASGGFSRLVEDYGLRIRPWPDLPLGIVIGVASQYLLVPLLELPLQPFVHNLDSKLAHPAQQLLLPVNYDTASFVVISVLVCVGSPVVEELFFRGLLLRGLLGRLGHLGPRLAPALSVVITGLVFGLAHFEALQFLGLAGFGMVLAYVAYRTGRLGPTIVAHAAFNTTTIIAFALQR